MGSDKGLAFSRLDTLEIKSLIYREIGHERADSYFEQLGKFFALRISKSEFDKFCLRTIGKGNIHLHNRLIHSVINNASVARSSPLRYPKKGGNFVRFGKGNQIQTLCGDSAFSPLSRKCRSRKFSDMLSPLGKTQSVITTKEESQSATHLVSLGSRPPVEVASVEEGEEVEQTAAGSPSIQSRSPVTAPLGFDMNLGKSGLIRKSMNFGLNHETCQSRGEVPDTRTLRNRLERRLEMEGIKVTMDSISLLNNGLDAFLKRLIEPCLSLAKTRCENEWSRDTSFGFAQQRRRLSCVSMSDFRAGMELNPQILGGEWPIILEKICSRGLEE
ncbi:unnamed protein product [Cochlearia groenlandica]